VSQNKMAPMSVHITKRAPLKPRWNRPVKLTSHPVILGDREAHAGYTLNFAAGLKFC
jgi:hypothetical protein